MPSGLGGSYLTISLFTIYSWEQKPWILLFNCFIPVLVRAKMVPENLPAMKLMSVPMIGNKNEDRFPN